MAAGVYHPGWGEGTTLKCEATNRLSKTLHADKPHTFIRFSALRPETLCLNLRQIARATQNESVGWRSLQTRARAVKPARIRLALRCEGFAKIAHATVKAGGITDAPPACRGRLK
jgi:hypothetical protein